MASPACVAAVNAATGKDLSQSEVEAIEQAVLKRRGQLAAKASLESDPAAFARAAKELADEEKLAAIVEKRSRAINVQTKLARFARYDANVGKELQTIREIMVGREGAGPNAAKSVDAAHLGLRAQLLGGLIADLRKAELLDVFGHKVNEFDRDVARELWKLSDPDATGTSNKQAQGVAKILNKYQEQARLMQNDAGAWIGKETGYITRQSHSQERIARAGYETWRDSILPKLSDRTFAGVDDREQFLHDVFVNLATGNHLKASGNSDWLGGFKGPGNLAKKASQERSLFFKSADDWFDYNNQFGTSSMMESIFTSLEHASRNTALMRVFGTNPRAAFESDVDQLINRIKGRDTLSQGDLKQIRKLNNWYTRSLMDQLDGSSNIVDNPTLAHVSSSIRALTSMAKLGFTTLSSFPDLATNAATLRHNGVGLLESWGTAIRGTMGGPKGLDREIADSLGVGIDGLIGGVLSRFSATDSAPGRMSKLMDVYFRANLLNWWTDSHKAAVGLMLSRNLASNTERAFGDLHPSLSSNLARYGINEAEWNLSRQGAVRLGEADDRYLTGDAMRYLSDDKVLAYLGDPNASAATIARTKGEIETNLNAYFAEQTRESMTEGGARERAILFGETRRGTPIGEAIRFMAQFKQFPLTFATRHLGREFARNGSIDKAGIAQLIAGTTLLGYASLVAKDALKGLAPRDPTALATWEAAFVQGGGAGIYGDYFFGNFNRFGGGFWETLLGPQASTVGDLFRAWSDIRDSASDAKSHLGTAAKTLGQVALNNLPFINIAYAQLAMDYLVKYHLQEAINPGFLKRYERRIEKDQHQTFWLRPSDQIQRGGGFR
jgi:hypothetical protein